MKTLLVHGYATKLRASVFRKPLAEHEGFTGLQNEIKNGKIDVFHWGIDQSLSFFESLNPFSYLKLYRNEERLAESRELQQKLFETIESSGTERVVCHSMGCRLLLNTIKSFGLPPSVRSIVFLQADADAGATLELPKAVSIKNYYCAWDQSLIASSILHRNLRVGMRQWKHANVSNHFYPLLRPINLHTSQLRNRKFLKSIV